MVFEKETESMVHVLESALIHTGLEYQDFVDIIDEVVSRFEEVSSTKELDTLLKGIIFDFYGDFEEDINFSESTLDSLIDIFVNSH